MRAACENAGWGMFFLGLWIRQLGTKAICRNLDLWADCSSPCVMEIVLSLLVCFS